MKAPNGYEEKEVPMWDYDEYGVFGIVGYEVVWMPIKHRG